MKTCPECNGYQATCSYCNSEGVIYDCYVCKDNGCECSEAEDSAELDEAIREIERIEEETKMSTETMRIEIQRNESSQPLVYENVINAYTKGPMYCVLFEKNGERVTHKFPLCSLFRVVEPYQATKK